jgi:Tfp pilus assembly protein FimT
VTVIAILALLTGLAAPRVAGIIARTQLEMASYKMRSDFEEARSASIFTGEPLTINIYGSRGYEVRRSSDWLLVKKVTFPAGITYNRNYPSFINKKYRFNVMGELPVDNDTIPICNSAGTRFIILATTGRARVAATAP